MRESIRIKIAFIAPFKVQAHGIELDDKTVRKRVKESEINKIMNVPYPIYNYCSINTYLTMKTLSDISNTIS